MKIGGRCQPHIRQIKGGGPSRPGQQATMHYWERKKRCIIGDAALVPLLDLRTVLVIWPEST